MKTAGRRLMPAIIVSVILAGILTPIFASGELSTPTPTQNQLTSLIGVAQTSKAYAESAVGLASSHGLDVSAAQAELGRGDTALVQAQADAQSGSNLAAGIQSVEAAMQDYTAASADASVELSNAGLTTSVDYAASEAAVAEVNATASVLAGVAAQACSSVRATTTSSSAFTKACADVSAQLSAAELQLGQAANILAQSQGSAGSTVNFTRVISFLATARMDVNATQSDLLTIASYGYLQRGQGYVTQVILPLSAEANATIKAEQSVLSNLTLFQTSFTAYANSQASASAGVTSSATTVGGAISQVDGYAGTATTSIGSAQTTESQLYGDLQVVLNLPAISALAGVVADIKACMSDASTYSSDLSTLQTQLNGFPQAGLSAYQGYVTTVNSDAASVQSSGSTYVSSFSTVVNDLQPFSGLIQVQAVLGLSVSGTVKSASTAISQETSSMATLGTDISTFNSAVTTAQTGVQVPNSLVSTATTVSSRASTYLNATAAAAVSSIATSVQATTQAANTFITSASACLQGTVGAYASNQASLSSAGTSLGTQTQASMSTSSTGVAYLSSATQARIMEAASGQSEAHRALQLFSNLSVAQGVAALEQASLELQAASTVNG